jgi:glycine/sarcosine N-methyltransferase
MIEKNTEFYQDLAPIYDDITRFRERYDAEREILQNWISRYRISSALDAACGTGLHAVILSTLGVRVVGADLSKDMLNRAKINASATGTNVKWVHASMQEISRKTSQRFDVIFCLGNSLPHLLTVADLNRTIKGFFRILNDSGVMIIQILNYDQILKEKKRIIGINRIKDREFIRFYDFPENHVQFNILTITWNKSGPSSKLASTILYPYTKDELDKILARFGFSNIEYYGDLKFSKYEPDLSSNLVVLGHKNSNARPE